MAGVALCFFTRSSRESTFPCCIHERLPAADVVDKSGAVTALLYALKQSLQCRFRRHSGVSLHSFTVESEALQSG